MCAVPQSKAKRPLSPADDAQLLGLWWWAVKSLTPHHLRPPPHREPIVSDFLKASYPRLATFSPRHLSAALHGLALFHRPPHVAYLDRAREGKG